jgi:hypothetical protein
MNMQKFYKCNRLLGKRIPYSKTSDNAALIRNSNSKFKQAKKERRL